jgi:hypothetical protein
MFLRKYTVSSFPILQPQVKNIRRYVSVPDMIFGDDDDFGNDSGGGKKPLKNPYIAKNIKGRFVGPWSKETNKKLWDVIRLASSRHNPRFKPNKKYENQELLKPIPIDKEKLNSTSSPHITWLGHASCYYHIDGINILTDPVWSKRASPFSFFGPHRFHDPPLPLEDLKVNVILLSHTHYDHLDEDSVKRIGNKAHW